MTRPPRPVPVGASARIKERQDQPEHLNRLLAYSHLYRVARRWRLLRITGAVGLAVAAPVLAVLVPAQAPLVGAVSAAWLVLGRLVLAGLEQHANLEAVRVHELYDTELFRLDPNPALTGRRPAPDDVVAAARRIKKTDRYLNWYSADLGDTPWPGDVLLCQRQSSVWSRRDHHAYGVALMWSSAAWASLVIALALVEHMSLSVFLLSLFLPSAPALTDAVDLARTHLRQSAHRHHVEDEIHDLLGQYQNDLGRVPPEACRRIQDAVFLLRRDSPPVPNWFYRARKRETEAVTHAGTQAIRSG